MMNFSLSKIGHKFSNRVVQKLILDKNVFKKKWSSKLTFINVFFYSLNFWLQKLTLKVWFWHFLSNCYSSPDFLKKNPLRMLILCQKTCFLEPTIFEIPQPNWYYVNKLWIKVGYIIFQSLYSTIFWFCIKIHTFSGKLLSWRLQFTT